MVANAEAEDLGEAVGDASNVLLLAPTFAPGREKWCTALLDHAADESGAVLYVGDVVPGDVVDSWRGRESSPERLVLVVLGDTRSSGETPATIGGTEVGIRTVETPGNLTKIGVELNEVLTDSAEQGLDVTVCFDSLTPLIKYSDVEKVYRFLHVLSSQVKATGAQAHYHLDPGAHDETDVNLLVTMVDAVVKPGGDGTVEVRTR